jgi:hypothetical protein
MARACVDGGKYQDKYIIVGHRVTLTDAVHKQLDVVDVAVKLPGLSNEYFCSALRSA